MARSLLRRLAIPSEVADAACELIRWHDERMPPTRRAMRRMLARLAAACPGQEAPLAFSLLDLRRADAVSKCPAAASWASKLDEYTQILREELASGAVFSTRHLAVGGGDIMRALGIAPGPAVGMQLDLLLAAVMEGEVKNTREALLAWLKGECP